MATVKVGGTAPEFALPDQNNKEQKLSDYKGKWVLLYFYPKDDTPGCTKEACGLRDNLPKFKTKKAVVFGVSADSVASHSSFATKFKLPFSLLADPQKKAIAAYGAWGTKQFMGKEYLGIFRNSYLIDPAGTIAKIYEKVKPEEHAEQVLADLAALGV